MSTPKTTDWFHYNPDQASERPDDSEIVEGFCVITGRWGSPCPAKLVPWEGVNHVVVYRVIEPPLSIPPTIAELKLHDVYMRKYDPENYCEHSVKGFPELGNANWHSLTEEDINKCFDAGIKRQWIGKFFSEQWIRVHILKDMPGKNILNGK